MFDLELFSLAGSNSHLVFCFCNLIIVILLVNGTKSNPVVSSKEENGISVSIVVNTVEKEQTDGEIDFSLNNHMETSVNVVVVTVSENELVDGSEENCNDSGGNEEICNESGDNDKDELRQRVEEFIEKVNRGWKAEKLRTNSYIQRERLNGEIYRTVVM
ncbi:hypothetical protein GIB67_021330 [Kingdonia uniflora]|uniref:Uncharacterized protein n=1 Tax=Kingdonia uniflora TaxID=39325 RepID=A0A7J7KZL4_9MAGN|nr:hypothetical protein GIB67_021330 [Kingdonia uniflora]